MDVQGGGASNRSAWPAQQVLVVTPSDSVQQIYRSLYVGDAAAVNVAVVPLLSETGDAVTFTNVQPGSILPVAVRRVMETGTSATSILGLR